VKSAPRPRSILHLDLDPFFVSVERSLDPALRGRAVIVGGDAGSRGIVAAASDEARTDGVRPGQPLAQARRLCPQGVFRAGDLENYARVSEDVTAILLAASRRVERPSADEAYVDLTPDTPGTAAAVPAAEAIKDQIQRRLGLDASLGLGSTRLAARVASRFARPRGLLVVLPGYEASFLARQPASILPDLPPHLEAALADAGYTTLGEIAAADEIALAAAVGSVAAARLRATITGTHGDEEPVATAAPPSAIQEEATIRSRHADPEALLDVVDGLATRAGRRLRPFGLSAGTVVVEVRRAVAAQRRAEAYDSGLADEADILEAARRLARPLLEPAVGVRGLQVRLAKLARPGPQAPLFPEISGTLWRSSLR
jgi:DNA polymerase-4